MGFPANCPACLLAVHTTHGPTLSGAHGAMSMLPLGLTGGQGELISGCEVWGQLGQMGQCPNTSTKAPFEGVG